MGKKHHRCRGFFPFREMASEWTNGVGPFDKAAVPSMGSMIKEIALLPAAAAAIVAFSDSQP